MYAVLSLLLHARADDWPTAGHDPQRRGRSEESGPGALTDAPLTVALPEEAVINAPPTVDADGNVYVATWGVVRSFGSADPRAWDKSDGQVFSLDAAGEVRWTSQLPRVPWCYDYAGHPGDEGCPDGSSLNWQNGTVEGTPTARDGVVYVGRGDGRLYALDAATGAELWRFQTFNPEDPADPDGGGELIGGPLVDAEGNLYVVTAAGGDWETNAVYSVSPAGELRWRWPADVRGADTIFWGAPALSPDGQTIYVPAGWGTTFDAFDATIPGAVLAFATDGTLLWTHSPVNTGAWWQPLVWPLHVTVGEDGTVYVGGAEVIAFGTAAVTYALTAEGDLAWPAMVTDDDADQVQGLALDGDRLLVTTGDRYAPASGYGEGGEVQALDARTGATKWRWDPTGDGTGGAMTGVAVDANGVAYTGVSGLGTEAGSAVALDADGARLWTYPLQGQLEWGHPVLAPGGALWLGDSHRCTLNAVPIEEGLCDGVDQDPVVYRLGGEPVAKSLAGGCGCGGVGTRSPLGALLALGWLAARRRASHGILGRSLLHLGPDHAL